MNSNLKLQIFILAYERPEYLREALLSVLQQDLPRDQFEVIVSDNSVSDSVVRLMGDHFQNIKLFRRAPSVPAHEHFRLISNEITSEFVVVFHDDDIMHPAFCRTVLEVFASDASVMAVATNALIIDSHGRGGKMINGYASRVTFSDKSNFLTRYITGYMGSSGIAPFPAYCYRRDAYLIPDRPIAGKYTDVVILTEILNVGKIVWLPSPLISYRTHEGNDSALINIRDFSKLCGYMKRNGISKFDIYFRRWRKFIWFSWYLRFKGAKSFVIYFLHIVPIPRSWIEKQVHRACLVPPNIEIFSRRKFPAFLVYSWRLVATFNLVFGYFLYLVTRKIHGRLR